MAVKNAGLTAKKTFSRQTGSILHISSDSTDLVGDGYGSGEIPEKAIVNIASNPNVKRVNNNLMAYAGLTSEKMVTRPNDKEQYKEQVLQVHGNSYSDTDPKYTAGMISLKEGRHITPKDQRVIIVHQAFAKTNHLKVGDKLMFSKDPVRNSKDKTLVEATIVGIYKGKTVQKSNYPYEMLENTAFSDTQLIKDLYGYSKGKAFYRQTTVYPKKKADIKALKSFIKKQSIDWNKYQLTITATLLTSYAKSIDVLNQLITSLQGGMLVVSIILVMMALLFWIGGRTHETGILLAIGKSKAIIIVSTQ
ncbi:ABC transporter permease [Streptococcus agalactiae]|nr:ABC transporter permease [Streptococcus agalactiae]MCC9976350.1 ABC transporter permease [Streptococcus agalactiae]